MNTALKIASKTPEGNYIELVKRPSEENVVKVLPYLKPKSAARLLSAIYDVDLSDIDVSRINPDTTSDPDRKQKRTRIEREQAALADA